MSARDPTIMTLAHFAGGRVHVADCRPASAGSSTIATCEAGLCSAALLQDITFEFHTLKIQLAIDVFLL
jgi:hypothetical protein